MRVFLFACFLFAHAAHAVTCTSTSGPTRATLLELYTSEGCSSCPPADRWLSQLPPDSGLVPLAFHVDYWDRLGWRDPFAKSSFSQRQRARNSENGWIYTPQVMLNGADYRNWFRSRVPQRNVAPAQVDLKLTLAQSPSHIAVMVDSQFKLKAERQNAQLFLALFENSLSSNVSAGENASRTLNHDYVVRELAGPLDSSARHRFKLLAGWQATNLGVAAFILNTRGETLQALAQPACP